MNRPNYRDPKTGEEIYVSRVRSKFVRNPETGEQEFKDFDKDWKPLENEDGDPLERIKYEDKDFGVPSVGLWSSRSMESREMVMRKRELEHNKKTGQKDNWLDMNTKT